MPLVSLTAAEPEKSARIDVVRIRDLGIQHVPVETPYGPLIAKRYAYLLRKSDPHISEVRDDCVSRGRRHI
jgi:hypothetical protein